MTDDDAKRYIISPIDELRLNQTSQTFELVTPGVRVDDYAHKQRRERIATAMAQGLLAGDNSVLDSDGYDVSYRWSNDPSDLASSAVRLADTLIAELDKGEL